VAALLFSVALYELPYVLTLEKTGWTAIPPVVEADQMLYLNLSAIHNASATEVVNPWYGDLVSKVDVPHLRFPITFLLFRFTHFIFGSWTLAILVWAAVWAALTFAAAAFCVDSLFPDAKPRSTFVTATALLVLQSPLIYLAEIRHLPSTVGFFELHLPYLRFAIPQVTVPFVLAYLGLQARVLKSASKWFLGGMAALQFAVCATFPYFLPVLAIGTAITLLIGKLPREKIALSWPTILGFGAICGFLDFGYLFLGGLGVFHDKIQFAPHFRPAMIIPCVRPFVIVLVIAAGLAWVSHASLAARTTVAGLALSNAVFGFSDVFFSPEAQILDHPHYLIALTTWLPLLVFMRSVLENSDSRALRAGLASALILTGAWEGFASFHSRVQSNLIQAAALSEFNRLSLSNKDLIVAPAQFADDLSSWVPVVSHAKVLFTPDGENILSAAETRSEQPFRQSAYLALAGMNVDTLTSVTQHDGSRFRFDPLLQQGDRGYQRSPLATDRERARSLVKERLSPLLAMLNADPAVARRLFAGFDRIVVIDSSSQPFFDPNALSRWFQIDRAYEKDRVRVWICHFTEGLVQQAKKVNR